MGNEQDTLEVVDEFTDNLDPDRIEAEAERLGLTVDSLLERVVHEVKTRLAG